MMGLSKSNEALSGNGDGNQSTERNEDNPPPPYQEASSSLSSSRQPRVRKLRVQYDEGKSPNHLKVFEVNNLGEGQQPLYWAKLHMTKLFSSGVHMEFKTGAHDEDIGSAKFHKTGSPKIDLKFRDDKSTTMTGYAGTTYAMMNFMCPSAGAGGRKLRWTRPGQGLDMICVCVDPNDKDEKKELASIQFRRMGDPVGEITIGDGELGQDGHWVEEMMISGLAYIHLSKYMGDYAGGHSSIGVGAT